MLPLFLSQQAAEALKVVALAAASAFAAAIGTKVGDAVVDEYLTKKPNPDQPEA